MPGQFLTTAERERWERFPRDLSPEDLANFFTLSGSDRAQIPHRSAAANRLGFALQLCALRYLGFCPGDLVTIPPPAVAYVAQQLAIDPGSLTDYGARAHTRTDHLQAILAYTGFRKAEAQTLRALLRWLTARALEHDRPTLLFQLACEKLRQDKVLRPGLSRLERLVITARHQARHETARRVAPLLTDLRRAQLDALLIPDVALGRTRLAWLQHGAVTASPSTILATLDKLVWLHALGVEGWDLTGLTPNRRKFLAGIARRSTNQALQRMPAERRYPILAAFLRQSLVEVIDEAIDLFDRCLADTYARARHELEGFREVAARATNEKVYLFRELGRLVLDPTIQDEALRPAIYARIPPAVLRSAVDEAGQIVRPLDDSYIDFLVSRYSYLRQFTPHFLEAFAFSSHTKLDPLLEALALLRALNANHRRTVPDDAPIDFVPVTWHPYVIDREGHIDRHAYELCVLWELRGALRAGNVWLPASRRYADPETHLIPRDRWPAVRADVCRQMQTPEDPTVRLQERAHELEDRLVRVDALLARGEHIRMEDGALIVPRLEAEDRPASVIELEQRIDARLPLIDLSELLAEVDEWTRFSRWFEHASGYEPPSRELRDHLYAALLAQGCNIGLTRMAQSSQTTYRQLAWCTTWYLREDTLKAATAALVNFHYHLPLSHLWGGGTLSSSDGQRFPVAGKVRNATALPRYFGYGKGITFYTWTSDQFSQYGTKVIPATTRDATYVLDEILDNETELPIVEHTTDTAGFTEVVFALFDLLGLQFAPRIRDLGDQRLYRLDRTTRYRHLEPRLKGTVRVRRILARWDDLLRVAGSLKLGWVTASLLISKLQAYPRQNALTLALQEYGRLVKTLFILRYLEHEEYRRRINRQLNKGEALHALRDFLFFANHGKVRRKHEEEQLHQAGCLNLLTNAVVVWNTVYMAAAIAQLQAEGYPVREEDVTHLSPARFEHINLLGQYRFEIDEKLSYTHLRPLRHP